MENPKKAILEVIKQQDVMFINFIFEKYKDELLKIGNYIIKNSFSWLSFESCDLENMLFETCFSLNRFKEEIILKQSIFNLMKYSFIQKIILISRKYNTLKNKALNNIISFDQYTEKNEDYEFDIESLNNKIELEIFISENKNKILSFKTLERKIFLLYYKFGFTRREIQKFLNIRNDKINNTIVIIKRKLKKTEN